MPGKYASSRKRIGRKRKRRSFNFGTKVLARTSFPNQSFSGFVNGFNPFPAKHTAELKYSRIINLNAAATTGISYHIFRANSIFDPDYTQPLSTQPYGHDQYEAIYRKYKVLKSVITMQPMSTSNSNQLEGSVFGCMNATDAFPLVDKDECFTTKGSVMLPVGSTQGGNSNDGKVMRYYSNKALTVDGQGTRCNFGTNPGDPHYFKCWMYSQELGTTMAYFVTVTYIVQMWDLKNMTPS